jgi:hypothetical protein
MIRPTVEASPVDDKAMLAALRPVPGMRATSAMTRVLMSAEKAAPAFT